MFLRLVKQMKKCESISKQLKAGNQMKYGLAR
ncbi:hypothetical protein [Megamonas sp. Calf98-2]